MKMQGPVEVDLKVGIINEEDSGQEGVVTIGMGMAQFQSEAALREAFTKFVNEEMPEGFRLMNKREYFNKMIRDLTGSRERFAIPGSLDWDQEEAQPEAMNEEARVLLLQGRIDQQDKQLATLREMERTYTNRLGELARLADPVVEWIVRKDTGAAPNEVFNAAEELLGYVEDVRPPEIPAGRFFEGGKVPDELRGTPLVKALNAGGEGFQTKDGDPAAHAHDGDWLQPTVNPFGHGCCDCGLYHSVEWRLVDGSGEPFNLAGLVDMFGDIALQLRFTRDEGETARLREHRGKSEEVCGLEIALDSIRRVASGEHQVADNDTEGMAWINAFIKSVQRGK